MQELNYNNWKSDIENKLESLKIKIDKNEIAKSAYHKFGFTGYELDPEAGTAQFWEKPLH